MLRFFLVAFLFPISCFSQTFATNTNLKDPHCYSYDVFYNKLILSVDTLQKTIQGSNTIFCTITHTTACFLINLHKNYLIDSIHSSFGKVSFQRSKDSIRIKPETPVRKGEKGTITIFYRGIPPVAKNPPWEGGFVWGKDSLNRSWIGVTCEGEGSDIWWPSKDTWSDEPDSASIAITVPKNLSVVSNGQLTKIDEDKIKAVKTFTWKVSYPINNYDVTLNIGHFAHFSDTLRSSNKELPLDYYVLDYNKSKAERHFKQVKKILETYETLFGSYPFPKDGYALIETPYWGMENQSAIAYGNHFRNDLLDFDFILVHETAHEWWGNSITAETPGQMWIHEAFATYAEALFLEKAYGIKTSLQYLQHQKGLIKNQYPIESPKGEIPPSYQNTDMYYKGAWMLHTLRSVIDNDSLWFYCLKKFATEKAHTIVNRDEVVRFFSKETHIDLLPFFTQYLDLAKLPLLQYSIVKENKTRYLKIQWQTPIAEYPRPVELSINGIPRRFSVNKPFQKIPIKKPLQSISINTNRYLAELRKVEP